LRYGGEEFVLLLPGSGKNAAEVASLTLSEPIGTNRAIIIPFL
jgi:GGDEF domain-containing protein